MTSDVTDPENLPLVLQTIESMVGFDCSDYSSSFLARRISVRLRIVRAMTYSSYAQLLRVSPEERDRLKKELTIHTTGFFRDAPFWHALERQVLPQLFAGKRVLRIWSAGCSTGEEALSLAIVCAELVGAESRRVSILATDIDADTIAHARVAAYEEQQFREMPAAYKEKYFRKQPDGLSSPDPALLRLITYEHGNILADVKPKGFDLILCRNTVIYFDAETKRQLYVAFSNSLVPNGFLVIGKTEILQGPAHERFVIFDSKERIYQKRMPGEKDVAA